MKKEGIIIIQHGDFPHDFKEKYRDMFDFIKGMINEVSQKTREIDREPDDCYMVDTRKVLRSFRRIGGYRHLEIGYMEFSKPTIEDAVQKLEKQGVKRVLFVNAPGIMMRSSHSLIDIPRILRGIKKGHSDLEMIYTPPGVIFDEMADVFIKRMDDALGKQVEHKEIPSGNFNEDWGVVLIAHGDVPIGYRQSSKKMEMTEKHIDTWSDMVRDWPRNEENDPLYFDTLELEKHIKEKVGYEIEIGNLEFSSPSLQEALNKLMDRGVEKVYFMGGTGFMDRSCHTLVDIPEALAKLKEDNPGVEIEYIHPNIDQVCDDLTLMLVEKVNQAIRNVECVS
ncbi:MAG: sirohydrochlorin chelatase [Halobacteriota archaeon]